MVTLSQAGVVESMRELFSTRLFQMQFDLGTAREPWRNFRFEGVSLHGVDLYRDEGVGRRRCVRRRSDVQDSPSGDFLLSMPFSESIEHVQAGTVQRCEPGEALLIPASTPFTSVTHGGRYRQYLGKFSGSLLRQRVPSLDRLGCVRLNVRQGAGKIVKSLLDDALSESGRLSATQREGLGRMMIDGLGNALADDCGRESEDGAFTSHERIRRRALNYIDCHLGQADLDVPSIAENCGVSARYLHAAFAAASLKVGALVRERRLDACRRSLLDPSLSGLTITAIAFRWGFEDSNHFSRAYRQLFGLAPRDDRKAHGLACAGARHTGQ